MIFSWSVPWSLTCPLGSTVSYWAEGVKERFRGPLWSPDLHKDENQEMSSGAPYLGEIWGHASVTSSEARGLIQEVKARLLSLMWDPPAVVAAHPPDRSTSSVCGSAPAWSSHSVTERLHHQRPSWTLLELMASASCCSYDKRRGGRLLEHHVMNSSTRVSAYKLTLLWRCLSVISLMYSIIHNKLNCIDW